MVVSHFVRSLGKRITTPTVKARFDRLMNVEFIKSISPILNFDIVEDDIGKSELEKTRRNGGPLRQ